MNPGRSRLVPRLTHCAGAAGLTLVLGGCIGAPDLNSSADPLVVTETGTTSFAAAQSPERAAAVADMRVRAESAEAMPFPDPFQSARTAELATREEPRSVAAVEAIEAELAAIARQRQASVSPQEVAALEARARQLRRLAAQSQAGTMRR